MFNEIAQWLVIWILCYAVGKTSFHIRKIIGLLETQVKINQQLINRK